MQATNVTGDIAQNVNFVIRGAMANISLQTNGIDYGERSSDEDIRPEHAAQNLQTATRLIQCVLIKSNDKSLIFASKKLAKLSKLVNYPATISKPFVPM